MTGSGRQCLGSPTRGGESAAGVVIGSGSAIAVPPDRPGLTCTRWTRVSQWRKRLMTLNEVTDHICCQLPDQEVNDPIRRHQT